MQDVISSIKEENFPYEIEGLQGGLAAFFIAELLQTRRNDLMASIQYKNAMPPSNAADFLLVVPTEKDAETLSEDLKSIFNDAEPVADRTVLNDETPAQNKKRANMEETGNFPEILQLPWWGLVPYRAASTGSLVFGERAGVLSKLAQDGTGIFKRSTRSKIFITTQRSLQSPVPPKEYIKSLSLTVKKGEQFDPQSFASLLAERGYLRVPRVSVRGEFTLRGEVLDIFMPGEDAPHRIQFDFDQIEKIKTFNVISQTYDSESTESDSLLIYPMKEVIWNDELIGHLEKAIEKRSETAGDDKNAFRDGLEEFLSKLYISKQAEGEEMFYSMTFEELYGRKYSIIDYLGDSATVIYLDYDRLNNAQESFDREYDGLYKKARAVSPVPAPKDILLDFKAVNGLKNKGEKQMRNLYIRTIHSTQIPESQHLAFASDAPKGFFGNINFLTEQITELLANGWKIYVYADSVNQALRIKELLRNLETCVLPLPLSAGFGIPDEKILVIQENEIFGRRRLTPKTTRHAKSAVIDTFVELNPGDYVVHVNYGIGLFKGIERVKALGNERDYIKIEYAEEENVFIPIEQVNLVQRYIGNEGNAPKLDRLGSKSWENRKNKVKKDVEDIADRLIELYSKRKTARGFPFPKDNEFQIAFEAAFPYDETDDQLTCIADVKADMEKPVPMDRLVCGDVGYGKTEIAMRAAFKAVIGGKQVAFLAPTTILAEQHYENCVERFQNFPVRIAHMSRFVSNADQKKILKQLAAGEIDILVGTHRIIQKDVTFKDLGLMIIDEEQRFGVKDKERLKELKNSIDSLAMSATPIPRTLHMSLLKIRDMSILNTAPHNRHPIETIIDAYNGDRVASAIRREVERGGQVFYLHNRVESLEEVRLKLQQLVPEMLIDTAHGQMTSTELDDIFRRFKMGGFHVLVSTTIIENGIDIPNVNTIIIDRADMYGISQLYQLRGRVGRSDRKAYAYMLYPENKVLSEIAMKRLQVISDFTELGAGFKIAMKDMEIRGAGNLLGKDQSGDVYSVGFDLYLHLLEQAIQRRSNENYQEAPDVLLELEYTGFIPETYIVNPQTKMEIYKKIASVSTNDELERVYNELNDRFGPIPDEVQSLLALAEIRIICKKLNILTLKERGGIVQVEFAKVAQLSIEKVMKLISESAGKVTLDNKHQNFMLLKTGKIGLKEKSEFIRQKLEYLVG